MFTSIKYTATLLSVCLLQLPGLTEEETKNCHSRDDTLITFFYNRESSSSTCNTNTMKKEYQGNKCHTFSIYD